MIDLVIWTLLALSFVGAVAGFFGRSILMTGAAFVTAALAAFVDTVHRYGWTVGLLALAVTIGALSAIWYMIRSIADGMRISNRSDEYERRIKKSRGQISSYAEMNDVDDSSWDPPAR